MDEKEQAQKLAASAPQMTCGELEKINTGYTAYIFRRRKTREIWTTCCGRHEVVPKIEYSDAIHAVMEADHQGEERKYHSHYCCSAFIPVHEPRKREPTPCPFCGRDAYVKELGRTGKRDNLTEYKRFVVLRWYRGALWARAYYTEKSYEFINNLTATPHWSLHKVYRFKPGEALCANSFYAENNFYSIDRLAGRPEKLPLRFYEPFSYNSAEGRGYTIVGRKEVGKSPFKYCQFEEFERSHTSAMRFLAICCIYPRQVEMLMKAGISVAVWNLIEGKKWNAAAFDWDRANPLVSFGLDKNEMKGFLAGDKNLEVLGYYKQFRRQKIKCEIADVETAVKAAPYQKAREVIKQLKTHRIEPAKWNAYIQREKAAVNGKKKRNLTGLSQIAQYWIDYIYAAETLGYDLENPLMQMPKGILKKHDLAVANAAPVLAARRAEMLSAQEKEQFEKVTARYSFETEQYLIRAPLDATEIADEGKLLHHCVGGYADRHMKGTVTILFLRSKIDPYAPLVTIEMQGDNLVQIHGYRNDITEKIKPREKYAEILNPWLDWVREGSKRDKEGNPKLSKKKESAA